MNSINFNDLSIIYVSGSNSNPYGHAILKLGKRGYIHVNALNSLPQFISDDRHFAAYLRTQGGRVIDIHPLPIRYQEAAKNMLKRLAVKNWFWKVAHHNCLTFIHKIAFAGGVSPQELGYSTNNIHRVPKFPLIFNESRNKLKLHLSAQLLTDNKTVQSIDLENKMMLSYRTSVSDSSSYKQNYRPALA